MNDHMKRKLKKLIREPKQFFIDSKIFGPIFCYFYRPILSFSSKQRLPLSLELPQRLFGITPDEDITAIMQKENIEALIFFWSVPNHLKELLRKVLKNYFIIYVKETPDATYSIKSFLKQYKLTSENTYFSVFNEDKKNKAFLFLRDLSSSTGIYIKNFDPLQLKERINSQIQHFTFPSETQFLKELNTLKSNNALNTDEVTKLIQLLRDLRIGPWSDCACNTLKFFDSSADAPYILVIGDNDLSSAESKRLELEIVQSAYKEYNDLKVFYIPYPTQIEDLKIEKNFVNDLKKYSTPVLDIVSISDALIGAKRVYTRKSLGGFFALLYNIPVTLFEKTFYAELGLTDNRWQRQQTQQQFSFEEIFYTFFFTFQHYEPLLKNKTDNFIIYLLKIARDHQTNNIEIFSKCIYKNRYKVGLTDFWPLLLTKNIISKITADKKNKIDQIFPIRTLLKNTDDSDTHLVYCFLFAGIMRTHPSWKDFLAILSDILPNEKQIEIFSLWNKMLPTDEAIRDRLLSAYDKIGDFESSRKVLRGFLNNENTNLDSDYRLFSIHQYKAAIRLASYEIRDGRLNKAFAILLSLLFSGFYTEDTLYHLALIEKYCFRFKAAKALMDVLITTYPQWKKDRAVALHFDICIMTGDIAHAFTVLALEAARGAEIPSFLFLQKKIITTYGSYDWQGIFASLVTEKALIAKIKSCILAEQFPQAYCYLCNMTPALNEIKNYFNAFTQYFILSRDFEETDNFLKAMYGKVPDNIFYTKAIEIEFTRRNYAKAKSLYQKCLDSKITISPSVRYTVQYLFNDLHGALATIESLCRFKKIFLYFLGNRVLESIENIDSHTVRSLLVLSESGPGDEIRGAGFYRQIANKAKIDHIVFTCDQRLYSLFKRSFPELEFHPYQRLRHHTYITDMSLYSRVPSPEFVWFMDNSVWDAIQTFDKVIRYYSARLDVIKSYEDVPGSPYLKADPILTAELRSRLKKKGKLLVGLCWRSSLQSATRRAVFLSVEELSPILELDCVHFVNCQYDGYTKEEELFLEKYSDKITSIPEIDQFNDLDSAAALYSALDIMVSCPTSLIDLAGALGVPTFTFTFTHALDMLLKPHCNYNLYCNSVIHFGYDLASNQHAEVVLRLREEILNTYNRYKDSNRI